MYAPVSRPRRRALALTLTLAVGLGVAARADAIGPQSSSTAPSVAASVQVPDSSFAIPAGAYFVSTTGSDSNAGTQSAPFRTIAKGVSVAGNVGGTVVVRAGTYRETISSIFRKVTIQAYPHEQVWMKGSQVLTGFAKSGAVWVRTGWNPPICRTCYDPNAITAQGPNAGLPDQLFFDGVQFAQVANLSQVVAGTFYQDTSANALYVGSDPTGHLVESTVYEKALQFATSGADYSGVLGIGFAHYAAHYNTDIPAAVIGSSSHLTFDSIAIVSSAARGLSITGTDDIVRNSIISYNGFNGMTGDRIDRFTFTGNKVLGNNSEHFLMSTSAINQAAGTKITATDTALVADNVYSDNDATGIWFDMSSNNFTIVRNVTMRNSGHGIAVEISANGIIASNVAIDNSREGVRVASTNNVDVWDNTIANNGIDQFAVYDDSRVNSNQAEVAKGITWNTNNVRVRNNLFSDDHGLGQTVIQVWDGSSPHATDAVHMISVMDNNGYTRASATAPSALFKWATLVGPWYSTSYKDLATFTLGVGRETAGYAKDTYTTSPLYQNLGNWNVSLVSNAPVKGTGYPLPANVASAIGVPAGVAFDRGGLLYPGSTWSPSGTTTTTTTAPTTTTTAPSTTTTTAPSTTTTAPTTTTTQPTGTAGLMTSPVYEVTKTSIGDYFYSIWSTDVTATQQKGYTYLGTPFKTSSKTGTGLAPIYRLMHSTNGDHLWTASTTERDNLVAAGWKLETTAFYAATSAASGTVPVYGNVCNSGGRHHLTLSATAGTGCTSEGVRFYAAP